MYDEYYGLAGRPFQLTPDPMFYFESGTHRKALSYLGYGLAQGEGFIVITGDIGTGKSTLVSHLMQTIDRTRMTAATIATGQIDAHELVQMATEAFGIDTRGLDKAATLKSVENFLQAEARTGRRCLLVVDEAQNLSIAALEELRMLSNFQLGSIPLLQIFLLGQPEFRDLVRDAPELEQLRQRVIATHHLDPMQASEIEPYIIHRLSRVRWTGNPAFAADTFPLLFAETGGVPRKLNTLMNRVMLMGAVESNNFIDASMVRAVIADMAGTPFAYDAQMSAGGQENSQAPDMDDVRENVTIAEMATETLAPNTEIAMKPVDVPDADANPLLVPEAIPAGSVETQTYINAPAEIGAERDSSMLELDILTGRLMTLEKRVAEQDDALRRVLATMIDWMHKEGSVEARFRQDTQAA